MRLRTSCLLLWVALKARVHAHSQSRGPLTSIALIQDPIVQTPSHRAHAASHFSLVFGLSGRRSRYRLALVPSEGILAPDAVVTYLDETGQPLRSEPINRQDHRIYSGTAYRDDPHAHGHWEPVGWARITLHRDGLDPLFEGVFTVGQENHHIQSAQNYRQTQHALDPSLPVGSDQSMVVWRDADIASSDSSHVELRRRRQTQDSTLKGLEARYIDADDVYDYNPTCNSNHLTFNANPAHPIHRMRPISPPQTLNRRSLVLHRLLGKRQIDSPTGLPTGGNSGQVNLRSAIGQTKGCPTTRKVALLGVAADCTYTGSFSSVDDAKANIINQVNSASSLYERTFNISLGLQNVTISPKDCPATAQTATPWNLGCSDNTTITDRLNTFSEWRGTSNDSNAYWTLMTDCSTGAEVGLAWLGQLCTSGVSKNGNESTAATNVVARTSNEWQVFAHESGHTFGAVHDCDSSTCSNPSIVNAQQCCPVSSSGCDAQGRYIMNPVMGNGITDFSPCTVGNICSALNTNSVKSTCLSDNKGVVTYSGAQCGNGIVEAGEDCDCGGTKGCGDNKCCNPTTCKFIQGAVCDDANEDCCLKCQFAPSSHVCRSSTGVCDPQETCSGTNATCPADQMAPDGTACGNSSAGLACASGQCTSRDQQCRTLMNSWSQTNDTYACNSQQCMLSCASPKFPSNQCYQLQQYFLDGTPCYGGGHCSNGNCVGGNLGTEIRSWVDDNKAVVIGVASAVGGLIVLAILFCCIRRYMGRRAGRRQPKGPVPLMLHGQQPPMASGAMPNAWQHPPPPPPPQPGAWRNQQHIQRPANVAQYPSSGQSVRYA